MNTVVRKAIQAALLLSVLTIGCAKAGSEFVGKWVNANNPMDTLNVSVRRTHVGSYRLLVAHAAGVSCGSLWMDKLASPGRTAVR